MKIQIYSKSIIGKNKKNNQDYYFWDQNSHQQILIGVADGVGSYEKSNIASQITGEIIKENFQKQDFQNHQEKDIKKWLKNVIETKIQTKIKEISGKVATTLSLMIIMEKKSFFCHIGNTRIYQFIKERQKFFLLTLDHEIKHQTEETFTWIMGDKFLQNSISNYGSCYIDVQEIMNQKGYLIFTSDGLHNFVQNDFLYNVIKNPEYKEEEKIKFFFEKARSAGSLDDITCLLVKID